MTPSPGQTLREVRERKPLVHQITNYVVMNETANATLALAVANGHELLASVTGTGCMSSAITGCFLAVARDRPLEAAAGALAAFGVAGEDAARDAKGPGSFHVGLYDALAALDPETLDARAKTS